MTVVTTILENWLSLIFNEMDGKDQILFILRKTAVLGDHTTEVGELIYFLQLLCPDCDSACLGRVAHVHDLGIIAANLEANFSYFFWCCHGMMHLWFIFFDQGDVICEIQVAETIEFRPVNAGPNACSSLLYDVVEGDEEKERG